MKVIDIIKKYNDLKNAWELEINNVRDIKYKEWEEFKEKEIILIEKDVKEDE